MKKLLFLATLIVMAFSSCEQEEIVLESTCVPREFVGWDTIQNNGPRLRPRPYVVVQDGDTLQVASLSLRAYGDAVISRREIMDFSVPMDPAAPVPFQSTWSVTWTDWSNPLVGLPATRWEFWDQCSGQLLREYDLYPASYTWDLTPAVFPGTPDGSAVVQIWLLEQ